MNYEETLTLTTGAILYHENTGGGGGASEAPSDLGPKRDRSPQNLARTSEFCAKRKTLVLFFSKTANFISYNLCKLYA